ncbi:MAG: methyltransferase type 11 [Bdellovibrio sp.]|nr:MAG: methyltransferase type 11 [Bdellovibrio sp.]
MTTNQYDENALPSDFDPNIYLELNADLKNAGVDPIKHYLEFGKIEGRVYNAVAGVPSDLDYQLHKNEKTKRPKFAKHETIWEWIQKNANQPGLRVLEIGSRSVISDALWKKAIPGCDYTGFDALAGKNVDVVGDIHRLSDYFSESSFDLVLSFAVFEHLAMPWIAVEEISKVLATNGHVVIETHFSYSEHELPWHFFQFNSNALEVMFCPELGFEIIDSGLDTPIVGRFSKAAAPYIRGQLVRDLYCHSSLIAKKSISSPKESSDQSFNWRKIIGRISRETMYPIDSDMKKRELTKPAG